jgi:hypothetical protein
MLLRNLSHVIYHGADVTEVLEWAGTIRNGDVESFYEVFNAFAVRVYV